VSVSPGIVDTGMGREELAAHGDAMKAIMEKTPVGQRMGRPQELAAVIAFLCSSAASFVSGVDWLVDGGSTNQVLGAV
jgi:NAD(P)-dependent dehydrogenase (short-subunit alcohol dehydrogenase family)